jgi:hypothetical protein
MAYETELKGGAVEVAEDAGAYAQEGVLTTFFRSRDGRTCARVVGEAPGQPSHRGHHPDSLAGQRRGTARAAPRPDGVAAQG